MIASNQFKRISQRLGGRLFSTHYEPHTVPSWLIPAINKSENTGYRAAMAGVPEQDVYWGHQDMMGHVNNATYVKWFEDARMNYLGEMERAALGTHSLTNNHGIGVVIRSAELQWRYPVQFPDRVSVLHRIAKIELDRFTLEGVVVSHKAQKVAARIREVLVTVDYPRGTVKVPIPDSIRTMLEDEIKRQQQV